MIIYFDMDGVLSDLDGTIAEAFGLSSNMVESDQDFRKTAYKRWFNKLGGNLELGFSKLHPHHIDENRETLRLLSKMGYQVEILSSLGAYRGLFPMNILTLGSQIHQGKTNWLIKHYLDLFEDGTINRFNTVSTCDQKRHFATSDSILVDDQENNIREFKQNGGRGVHFHHRRRVECIAELRAML